MKANELMIDDWAFIKDFPIKALPQKVKPEHFVRSLVEFEPIPLIQEILERNGFTKSTPPPGIHARCYELDNKKDKYNLTIADYNKYKRLLLDVDSEDSECFNIKCDYVHKLQQALRLCGIEKTIEL